MLSPSPRISQLCTVMSEQPVNAVGILMRKKDWQRAVDEYNKAALSETTMRQYIAEKNAAVRQYQALTQVLVPFASEESSLTPGVALQLAQSLVKWRNECIRRMKQAKEKNLQT